MPGVKCHIRLIAVKNWGKGSNLAMLRKISVVIIVGAVFSALAYAVWPTRRPSEFVGELSAPFDQIMKMTIGPDGQLAAANAEGRAAIWEGDLKAGRELERLSQHPILTIGISRDGFLAAGTSDGQFFGWQIGSDRNESVSQLEAPVTCFAFRPAASGQMEVVLGLGNGKLAFIDGSGLKQFSIHKTGTKTLNYHPAGNLLVTAGANGDLIWIDARSRETIDTSEAHGAEVSSVLFADGGNQLVSGDWNGEIKIWDVRSRKLAGQMSQEDAVSCMTLVKQTLVTGSWDGNLRTWNLAEKKLKSTVDTGAVVYDIGFLERRDRIATCSNEDTIELWCLQLD